MLALKKSYKPGKLIPHEFIESWNVTPYGQLNVRCYEVICCAYYQTYNDHVVYTFSENKALDINYLVCPSCHAKFTKCLKMMEAEFPKASTITLCKIIRRRYLMILHATHISQSRILYYACDRCYVNYQECFVYWGQGALSLCTQCNEDLIEIKKKVLTRGLNDGKNRLFAYYQMSLWLPAEIWRVIGQLTLAAMISESASAAYLIATPEAIADLI